LVIPIQAFAPLLAGRLFYLNVVQPDVAHYFVQLPMYGNEHFPRLTLPKPASFGVPALDQKCSISSRLRVLMHLLVCGPCVLIFITMASALRVNSAVLGKSMSKLSVMYWNVNGLRSLFKHDAKGEVLRSLIKERTVDILCLQETKIQSSHVTELDMHLKANFDVARSFWSCSTARKGYSGTATLLLNTNGHFHSGGENIRDVSYNIGNPEGDVEGRSITIETDKFKLVNTYVPNSGAELVRLNYRTGAWDVQLAKHIQNLKASTAKPVILVGDMNVAYSPLDYHNPQEPRTKLQACTTPQEQRSFSDLFLQQCGLVDTFRARYPTERRYSYFSNRLGVRGKAAQMGMRLDYVLHYDGRNDVNRAVEAHSEKIDGIRAAGDAGGVNADYTTRVLDAYIEDQVRYAGLVYALIFGS
jgi:exodeoxyribonuclease-3